MTRYGAVLDFSGPFSDGDGICDLTGESLKYERAASGVCDAWIAGAQQLLLRKRSILTVYTRGKRERASSRYSIIADGSRIQFSEVLFEERK